MIHPTPERGWIMAASLATRSSRGHRTICLPIAEETYRQIVNDPVKFRHAIDDDFRRMPELFPRNFEGYQLMGHRVSAKQGVMIRRVRLKDGTTYSIRPSFLMPYMTARTEDVRGPLFLRTFGVPFWALAHVFGRDPMCIGIGWCAGWAASASWEPPSARRRCPRISWPTRIISHSTGGRSTSPPRSPTGAVWGRSRPRRRSRVCPQDRQHRRLEVDASRLEGSVPAGDHPSVSLARVAQDPGSGRALERTVRGRLPPGLGGVSGARPPELRATAPLAAAVGDRTPHGDRPGEGPGPVRQARAVVEGVPPSRRPPHEQHAGSPDAGNEPLLQPWPTPSRLVGGVPPALPGVGVVGELRTLAPGDDAAERGLEVSRRTPQPTPLS